MSAAKIFSIICFYLAINLSALSAQKAILSGGANAKNNAGAISYSIGQPFYTTATSSEYTITQGIQQAFEILILSSILPEEERLKISVFPNPVNDLLIINTIEPTEDLSLQLFDSLGELLESQRLKASQHILSVQHLNAGIYFLKVSQQNQWIQTYKIFKYSK